MRKVWVSIPGMVKSAQSRRRLATAATFLYYASAKGWAPVTFAGVGSQHSPSPLTIAEKMKPFLKRTDSSSFGACRNCYHVFILNNTIPHRTFSPHKYNDHPSLRLHKKLYDPPVSVFTTRALITMQCYNTGIR